MKKKIALVLAASMAAASLAACGGGSQPAATTAAAAAPAETKAGAAAPEAESVALDYPDYEASDKFVAANEAAKYEGTDEWPETTWNFDCSTGDTSTWAQAGYYFNALMQESTGGKVEVAVYAGEQLSNGSQVDGIQMLMDGDTLQVSLHSNLIYANFDTRFNVVSLPYLFADYDAVDKAMAGEGGEALKGVLSEYGLHCAGIAENGFRQITNSKKPITTVADLSDIKMRICSNDLCAEVYKEWGCDATVMNWSETYTALQQGTVDGQENPETAISSNSVQDVQNYLSLWNAYYDCLFFCINENAYNMFTDDQKAVIDANAAKAVEYQKSINRTDVDAIVADWTASGAMEVTPVEDIDTESFRTASAGAYDWYANQLMTVKGMSEDEAKAFIAAFQN